MNPAPHPRPPFPPTPRACRSRQRGSVLIAAAAAMLVSLTLLVSADLGYLFYQKRELQKTADLAALAGAQVVGLDAACAAATAAAVGNAASNGFELEMPPSTVECGRWAPLAGTGVREYFTAGHADANAVKIVLSRSLPLLFARFLPIEPVLIRAQAIAFQDADVAAFSVGAQLLRVDGGAFLGRVLKGVGVDIGKLTVLDSAGLARVKITPAGLLEELGIPIDADLDVATFNALLAAHDVSIQRLLEVSATAVERSGVAGVDLTLARGALQEGLAKIGIDIGSLAIPLGSRSGASGLFAEVVAPTASAALKAEVSVAELIKTALGIATAGRAVLVDGLDLGVVRAQVGVVEPPSLGIGGIGARAFNSQVRVFLDIDTDRLLGGLAKSLLHLRVPLYIDVVNGAGRLDEMHCDAAPRTATIDVTSSILQACTRSLGTPDMWSTVDNLCADTPPGNIALTLLGLPVAVPDISVAAFEETQAVTLEVGQTRSTDPNSLALGTAVENVANALLGVLGNLTVLPTGGNTNSGVATQVAQSYLRATTAPGGRYDGTGVITLLQNGSAASNLGAIGSWNVSRMVPYPCGLLNVATCWKDGTVWEGYASSVTGSGYGVLDSLLNAVLGGLVVKNCSGLVSQLLTYNSCVEQNLASYLQTKPGGLTNTAGAGSVTDPRTAEADCGGLVCQLIKPVLKTVLKPVFNGLGNFLSATLRNVLGIEIGRTDVKLMSLSCNRAQLVY